MDKLIIGRKDVADFPDFGLTGVEVKIDSGAYTSSIHVDDLYIRTDGDQEILVVQFKSSNNGTKREYTEFTTKTVKSSAGIPEERYFIQGSIVLFGIKFNTPFSLTQRSGMKYDVLLGRKLLNGNFLIDSAKVNLSKRLNNSNIK